MLSAIHEQIYTLPNLVGQRKACKQLSSRLLALLMDPTEPR